MRLQRTVGNVLSLLPNAPNTHPWQARTLSRPRVARTAKARQRLKECASRLQALLIFNIHYTSLES